MASAEVASGNENPVAIWRHGKSDGIRKYAAHETRKYAAHDFIGGKFLASKIPLPNQSIFTVIFTYGLGCKKTRVLGRGMYDSFTIVPWKCRRRREIDNFVLSIIINHSASASRNRMAADEKNAKGAKDSSAFYPTSNLLYSHSAYPPKDHDVRISTLFIR